MSKRYFINNLDSYLGQALYRQIYNPEQEDDTVIIGTKLDPLDKEKLPGVKKILNREKPKLFTKYLIESDVCIYDLHFGDIEEIKFAVEGFKKKQPFDEQKTLILISSVLVWDGTPRKIKPPEEKQPEDDEENADEEGGENKQEDDGDKEDKDADDDDDEDIKEQDSAPETNPDKEGSQQGEGEEGKGEVIEEKPEEEEEPLPEYVPFREEDYKLREPREQYQKLKELEDLVLELNIENLKVFVICSGIFYGAGELVFKNHFKAAWLQNPAKLPYIGEGENLIPTIHIDDLAKFTLKITDSPPENPYLFAFDLTEDRAQKNIVESISRLVGTGEIESIEEADEKIIQKQFEDTFRINLDMIPSPLLYNENPEEDQPEFEWTAQKGIPQSIEVVLKEFCSKEKLKPIKIMIKGQLNSRKSHFGQVLAKHYNIPHIKVKDILNSVDEKVTDRKIVKYFNKEKEQILQYFKDKKEKDLDESLKVFYRLIRWRLRQNDCKNRGYVLDDFPNHLQELNYVFIKKNEKKLKRVERRKKRKKRKQDEFEDEEGKEDQEDGGEGEQGTKPDEGQNDSQLETGGNKQTEDDAKSVHSGSQQDDAKEDGEDGDDENKEEIKSQKSKEPTEPSESSEDSDVRYIYEEPAGDDEEKQDEDEENQGQDEEEEEEEEEEGEDGQKKSKFEPYYPDSLIYFKSSKETNDTDEVSDDEKTFEERLEKFNEYEKNTQLYEFFRDQNTDFYIFEHENKKDDFERFSSLRVFIEKDGRPNNYLETTEELSKEHAEFYDKEHQNAVEKMKQQEISEKEDKDHIRIQREGISNKEFNYLFQNEKPDPEEINKPFRNYLMEYITPVLGEGLLNISEILPDDPVDFLSEYLFKKSFELQTQKIQQSNQQ